MNKPNQGRFAELVHPPIRELKAYQVQPADGLIKLDAMESPYGFDRSLQQQWTDRLSTVDVNLYPDPHAQRLKARLRRVFHIPDHLELTLGNGSDELLQLIQLAVGGPGRKIMSPQPSFVMYQIIAQYTRASFIGISLNEDFTLAEDQWLSTVESEQPDCVFFSHPNNPTGDFFSSSVIRKTAQLTKGLVIVDEAYYAYSKKSMLRFVDQTENLIVVRTLSKSSLAGLRIGYMISQPVLAAEFEKLRLPYNVGVLAQEGAVFALDHWDQIDSGIQRVLSERKRVQSFLSSFHNLHVFPSEANFLTVRFLGQNADDVYNCLKNNGILVKNLDNSHPVLANCLRFTIGSADQNTAMIEALSQCLRAASRGNETAVLERN